MKNLKLIIEKANAKLGKQEFVLSNEETISNTSNRYEGNDLDMTEDEGVYVLRITGLTTFYYSIEQASKALEDMLTIY